MGLAALPPMETVQCKGVDAKERRCEQRFKRMRGSSAEYCSNACSGVDESWQGVHKAGKRPGTPIPAGYIGVVELAARVGCEVSNVYAWIKTGKLKPTAHGKIKIFKAQGIMELECIKSYKPRGKRKGMKTASNENGKPEVHKKSLPAQLLLDVHPAERSMAPKIAHALDTAKYTDGPPSRRKDVEKRLADNFGDPLPPLVEDAPALALARELGLGPELDEIARRKATGKTTNAVAESDYAIATEMHKKALAAAKRGERQAERNFLWAFAEAMGWEVPEGY